MEYLIFGGCALVGLAISFAIGRIYGYRCGTERADGYHKMRGVADADD